MTTNALLLPKYIEYLSSKKFKLLISLDGDEQGSSLRQYKDGSSAFKDIKAAVDYVYVNYPSYFKENIEFNSVLSSRTSVKEIIDYIKSQYNKVPSISEINTDGVNPNLISEFNEIHADKWNSMMEMEREDRGKVDFLSSPHFERIARYVLGHSPFVYQNYNELLYNSQDKRKENPTGTCLPFTKRVFVTVTGNIMPCERISYSNSLGKIDANGLSIDFNQIASMYNRYYDLAKSVCIHCKERNSCLTCIFYSGLLDDKRKPKCKYFVTQENAKATELEVYNFLSKYPGAYNYIMDKFEIH